jgi:hypothetical protein
MARGGRGSASPSQGKRKPDGTPHRDTRHVKAALSAMTVKTDRKDARGIAQLMRIGWFRPVHAKSIGSQEIRACWLRANYCSAN